MKSLSLTDMTVHELVQRFVDLAIDQDNALLGFDTRNVNRIFRLLSAIEEELRARDGDQRRALLSLYKHPNPQVRLKAAQATLALQPRAARAILEELATLKNYPQALEAHMTLWDLDRGAYKPA